MSYVLVAICIAGAAYGFVMYRMALNALAASERHPEQHEHVAGDWQ
jgi:uncharacterized membrane protein YpjA